MMHTAISPASPPQLTYDAAGPLTSPALIFAGDSMTADSQMGSPPYGGVTTYTASHASWLRWLTARRFYWDAGQVFATPGFTTTQWIATHMANAVAACRAVRARGAVPIVVLRLGTNDLTTATPLSAITANFETIFSALHSAGAIVVAYLAMPRSGANVLSSGPEKTRLGLNAYLARKALTDVQRVIPFDPAPYMVDASTGAARTGYSRDGLHGTAIGYAAEAAALAPILNTLAPPVYCGQLDADDTFDAVSNPYGNRLVNGSWPDRAATRPTGRRGRWRTAGTPPCRTRPTAALRPA